MPPASPTPPPSSPPTPSLPSVTRVNLQQVARRAQVSPSTASRCLRGDMRFPENTRLRVEAAARELGYHPDPMLRALVAWRMGRKQSDVRAEIAWLHPYKGTLRAVPVMRHRLAAMFDEAQRRAAAFGYRLVEFALPNRAAVPEVNRILAARGIEGAVLCAAYRAPVCEGLDFSRMAVVSVGYAPDLPVEGVTAVSSHHFRGALRALDELRRRSGRRLGLALFNNADTHADHLIRAGYAYARENHPGTRWAPSFVRPCSIRRCRDEFRAWFLRYKPDAILTNEWLILHEILALGYAVPADVSVALTDTAHPQAIGSGIYANDHVLGACAINQLVPLIQRREFGCIDMGLHVFVENDWIEGQTVRPLAQASPEELARRAAGQQRLQQRSVPVFPHRSFAHRLPNVGYGYGVPAPVRQR